MLKAVPMRLDMLNGVKESDLYLLSYVYDHLRQTTSTIMNKDLVGFGLEYMTRDMISELIKNGKIKDHGTISYCQEESMIGLQDNEWIFRNSNNRIYADEDHQICIVYYYPHLTPTYNQISSTYIFAESKEKCATYLKYLKTIYDDLNKDKIISMKDNGYDLEIFYEEKNRNITYQDVYLEDDMKKEVINSIDSFFQSDMYKKFNIPHKRGILLYGLPGNGKTTLIKAIANEVKHPVVYWQITEKTSSASIETVFNKCKSMNQVVLVIEDIDSLPEYIRSTFLNYLDGGVYNNNGIFIIGTTNFPEKIDPALVNRAGRFDRAYEIKPPSADIRRKYLLHLGIDKVLDDKELDYVVGKLDGFSVATLNEIYTSIVLNVYYNNDKNVDKVINSIKESSNKQKNNKWFKEESKVGF